MTTTIMRSCVDVDAHDEANNDDDDDDDANVDNEEIDGGIH